jgi:hypothetical protein
LKLPEMISALNVAPMSDLGGNLAPRFLSEKRHGIHKIGFFTVCPGRFGDMWVQASTPSLRALCAGPAASDESGDLVPVLNSVFDYSSDQTLVFELSPSSGLVTPIICCHLHRRAGIRQWVEWLIEYRDDFVNRGVSADRNSALMHRHCRTI